MTIAELEAALAEAIRISYLADESVVAAKKVSDLAARRVGELYRKLTAARAAKDTNP